MNVLFDAYLYSGISKYGKNETAKKKYLQDLLPRIRKQNKETLTQVQRESFPGSKLISFTEDFMNQLKKRKPGRTENQVYAAIDEILAFAGETLDDVEQRAVKAVVRYLQGKGM